MKESSIRNILVFGIVILFIGATAIPTMGTSSVKISNKSQMGRATLYVGGIGPNNYSTIQGAIDDAGDGDTAFVYGRLANLTVVGEIITFDAVNIRVMTFFPYTFNTYTSGEMITLSKYHLGFIGIRFIFVLCGVSI
ncbi:MAG: hypothetical protein JSW60_06710 [Thermoplasmatales archaeon]|nr:MAG: hypothetical protein JSW60_06710 [Thermoplasmatales archaeon]